MNTLTQTLLQISSQFAGISSLEFLQKEVEIIGNHQDYPTLRIGVFAPFNHGKSTLLNSLLGSRTLPVSLMPTTGTAITIKNGGNLKTRIQLSNGEQVYGNGTDVLQEYAVLNGQRRMREDVVSVTVFCPNALLAKGVELIDLPGTSDMEEQDELVYNELLSVDLVICVLDARKLLTMTEVDQLQEWLLKRGIDTAIFVLNFVNLIEEMEDRQEITRKARYIACEFRSNFPDNLSNLYRVDALPALRARVKNDHALSVESGIVTFENSLYTIADLFLAKLKQLRLPRLRVIGERVKQSLQRELNNLNQEIRAIDSQRRQEVDLLVEDAQRMQNIFAARIESVENWLSEKDFITRYSAPCLQALLDDKLKEFVTSLLDSCGYYFEPIERLLEEGSQKFNHLLPDFPLMTLPDFPEIVLPTKPLELEQKNNFLAASLWGGICGTLIAGPVGAAVGVTGARAWAENAAKQKKEQLESEYNAQVLTACQVAVKDYLESFQAALLVLVSEYQDCSEVLEYQPPAESSEVLHKRRNLSQLKSSLLIVSLELKISKVAILQPVAHQNVS